ncbi:tetratricopeptide repeat protein [candidate division KSB1 bacterium]|nr:tetratricopeptide repeat protein [candidate division KSB1 bacterium]
MKRLLLWTTIILLTATVGRAQDEFASFTPDVLATGLGGSLVSLPDYASTLLWNPGAMAFTTTDQILITSHQPFTINNLSVTKFFAPCQTIGFGLSQIIVNNQLIKIGTLGYGRRLTRYFSIGGNLNYGNNNETNEDFTTCGIGMMLRPALNQTSFYRTDHDFADLFFSPALYEKFALGFSVHNMPLGNSGSKHNIRIGAAFKFSQWGPYFHLAYHKFHDAKTIHTGMGFRFSPGFQFVMGTTDFNLKDIAFGGSFAFAKLSTDLIYSSRSQKVSFTLGFAISPSASVQAQRHKEKAIQMIRDERFRGALKEFEKSLSYNQNNEQIIYFTKALEKKIYDEDIKIDSLYNQATTFQQKNWNVSAVLTLKEILGVNRYNERAIRQLRTLRPFIVNYISKLYENGISAYRQHDFNKSRDIFQDILQINERHEGALRYLSKIDSANSHLTEEYYYQGIGYYRKRHYDKATRAFAHVLELNPTHNEARLYMERINREMSAQKPVIKSLLSEALQNEREGNYQLASQKYQEILNINRDNEKAETQLKLIESYINNLVKRKFQQAKKLFQEGNYEAARAMFTEILSMSPNDQPSLAYIDQLNGIQSVTIDSTLQSAYQLFGEKRYNDALIACDKALLLNSDHEQAKQLKQQILEHLDTDNMQIRALQMFRNGDYANARQLFRQILERDPNNLIANSYVTECNSKINKRIAELFNSGMTFYTSGNYEAAIRDWDRILEIEPDNQSALDYKKRAEERLEALNQLP